MRTTNADNTRRELLASAGALGVTAALAVGGSASGQHGTAKPKPKIFIFNALWFKPDGGAEGYAEYGRAVGPIVAKYGGRIDGRSYKPSIEAFQTFTQDPDLPAASAIREDAIIKSLLIHCDAVPSPV